MAPVGRLFLFLFLLFLFSPIRAGGTRITDLKVWTYPNYIRVILFLEGKIPYEVKELKEDSLVGKPPRIYLDLYSAEIGENLKRTIPVGKGLLKDLRLGYPREGVVRVVLDLKSLTRYQVTFLPDPYRLMVDLLGGEEVPIPLEEPSPSLSEEKKEGIESLLKEEKSRREEAAEKNPILPSKPKKERKRYTIVVDPGHGGHDPGAIGYGKVKEKDLTLRSAILLKNLLEKEGYKVVLTRTKDQYLTLEERTLIANRENADLFVSLHMNSSPNKKAEGWEIYYLSTSFDRATRILVQRENFMSESSLSELEELLLALDLSQRTSTSQAFARLVSLYLPNGYAHPRLRVVKGAPFYVLVGTQMPAILVELGFITNPKEVKRLRDPAYLNKMGKGIVAGIKEFLRRGKREPI